MKLQVLQGGWYCESQPNGAYAVVIRDSHIETSRGPVPLCPGGNLLQLRLAADGVRFAGTGHNDGIAWEWTGVQWANHGPTFGNSACIYDASDMLNVVSRNIEPTWAQGWAFLDDHGQLVPGWVAYAAQDGLSAWTQHGAIAIGQGHDTGGVITAHGLQQIATGQATWVRFNQVGDSIALAWIQEDHNEARLLWLTVAELLALKPVNAPVVIDNGGEVLPTPKPEPVTMRLPDAVQQIVNALYAQNLGLAQGTDDQRRALTKLIAEQTVFSLPGQGWGWKSADPGRPPSKDGIAKQQDGRLLGFDLFNGGTRAPNDHPSSEDITGQNFIPVAGVDHLGGVTPKPQTPPPAPSQDPALKARIAELERQLAEANATIDLLQAATKHLNYDDMMQTVAACDAAYEGAQHGRKKTAMLPSLTAHLVYRMGFEGYTREALIEDARERGAFL